MISLILVLHTLLALLSCPPFALGVTLLLTQVNFYPTVSVYLSRAFLFNHLEPATACYAIFRSLKNSFLHSEIEQLLKSYLKSKV